MPDNGTVAISPEQLQIARKLFELASVEHGPARESILSRGCEGDSALRTWVEQMIDADTNAHPILDHPLGLAGPAEGPGAGMLREGSLVGPYRILREIGVGGMGTVYQARHENPADPAPVAIKVVRWHSHEISRRFEQEQAILSGLRHPNIARFLGSGTTEDHRPYFVMEYVEGLPIHLYCERNGMPIGERVRLFQQVCTAVVYLHQNLVIHRDLKPGNVLVAGDGTVKLVDFGIAKLLQAPERALSPVSTIAGLMTPDYASPEQIRGGATSTLTDVYSLGVLLYELLTGSRPFTSTADQVLETLRRICEEEPRKPSVAASERAVQGGSQPRKLRGELDTIVLKAMRKEPERRYASVEQLNEDLRRYLDGQPVLAQGDSLRYRTQKFVTRHKGGVAAGVAMVLMLAGGGVSTGIEARIAQRERSAAQERAREADDARGVAEREKHIAEEQRLEANLQRVRAEQQAAEAERQRAKAERRLEGMQVLAQGAAHIYDASGAASNPEALIAENVRNSLLALGRETKLGPGLAELLDKTSATIESYELATDASWQVPSGWSARETNPHEYRVGIDHRIVHGGRSSLFVRSIVPNPGGQVLVFQTFSARSYLGKRLWLKAFLRSEMIAATASLQFGVRAENFDPMPAAAEVFGTSTWKHCALVVEVPLHATEIYVGIHLTGTGTLWADDFSIEQVGSTTPLTIRVPENLNFTEGRKTK